MIHLQWTMNIYILYNRTQWQNFARNWYCYNMPIKSDYLRNIFNDQPITLYCSDWFNDNFNWFRTNQSYFKVPMYQWLKYYSNWFKLINVECQFYNSRLNWWRFHAFWLSVVRKSLRLFFHNSQKIIFF